MDVDSSSHETQNNEFVQRSEESFAHMQQLIEQMKENSFWGIVQEERNGLSES